MYYIGSRNPLTILVFAGMLAGAVLWAKHWIDARPSVVAERFSEAEIVSIDKKVMKTRGRTGIETVTNYAIAKLRLSDGKEFRSSVYPPYPEAGASVSVRVVEYSDGSRTAAVTR